MTDLTDDSKSSRFNTLKLGLLFGYLSPPFTLLIVYSSSYSGLTFFHYLRYAFYSGNLINVVISCLIPDLLAFALFMWRDHNRSAKGIVIASVSLTVALILFKVILLIFQK